MPLRLLFFLSIVLFVSAVASAQTVSLSEKEVPLEKVFREIKARTGFEFVYNLKTLEGLGKVTVEVRNVSLAAALDACFRGLPLTYTITNKIVVIMEKLTKPGDTEKSSSGDLEISGTVLTEKGEPLEGATVEISGLNLKELTNARGEFVLKKARSGKYILDITFVGYEEYLHEIEIKSDAVTVAAVMKYSTSSLDQVQIIAYGTTTQRMNVGNVSTVKAETIEKQPVSDPLLALQGRVPGLSVTQSSGLPGASLQVQIRGLNSISEGSTPLFIIDGVPYPAQTLQSLTSFLGGSGSPFSFLNPSDIESIDVLKDASATAIYGSQGANGVILITTKKGKAGQTKVDLTVESGFGKVPERLKVLNTPQYLEMRHEAFKNDNLAPNPSADFDLTLWDTSRSTDWQKVLLGGATQYQDFQSSLSGGNLSTQFLFGAGFHRETNVFPGDFSSQKGSGHLTVNNVSSNKKFKIQLSTMYSINSNTLCPFNFVQAAVQLAPDAPPLYKPDGSINWEPGPSGYSTWPSVLGNPVAELLNIINFKTYDLVTAGNVSYEIMPGLTVKTHAGYTNLQSNEYRALPFAATDPATWATSTRESDFSNDNIQTWIVEPQLSYNGRISRGIIDVLAGATLENRITDGYSFRAEGFSSDQTMNNILAATSLTAGLSINSVYMYNAGYGRVKYNWQDKYLIDVSMRRDGSSRFGPANQFHNFYAAGAGWLFYKEDVFRDGLPVLSYGKLRASYGTTGSDNVSDYSYLDLYNNITGVGVPYQGANGIYPSTLFNPYLSWESTKKLETGLELGFLKDRIIFKGSFYRTISTNQLVEYALPDITGSQSINKNLNAVVQNQGEEIELETVNVNAKAFRWASSFNLSINRNKLAAGAAGLSAIYQRLIGHPLMSRFLYHCVGADPITGFYKFSDSKGNPTSNPNPATDQTELIDLNPRYFGGLENTLAYKTIELSFLIQFVRCQQAPLYLFNIEPGSLFSGLYGMNQPIDVLKRWRAPGDVSDIERFSETTGLGQTINDAKNSDLVYGDASFIRLRNISLNWRLPDKWESKTHLQHTSVFIHGQNILVFTKYRGFDPEVPNMDCSILPPLRVITFGVKTSL